MNTLQEDLRGAVAAHEASLRKSPRPDLLPRARKRRRITQVAVGSASGAALVGLGVGTAVLFGSGSDLSQSETVVAEPAYQEAILLNSGGGVLSEDASSAVVVDVYLDPMCPYCGMFGTTAEQELIATDGVTVVFHPVAFLDRLSSDGSYSTRAGSAIQEVAAFAPDRLPAFLEQLWAQQPPEGGSLTDAELQDLARLADVPDDIVARFPEHRFAAGVATGTQAAIDAGVTFVPYVTVNGELYEPTSYAADPWRALFDVIEEAQASQE